MPIQSRNVEFDVPQQEEEFLQRVDDSLRQALDVHDAFEARLARFKRAYKALPEQVKKTFPWDGAANIVIPFVGVAVDAIVAKEMAAIFSAPNFAEVQIKNPAWESAEKKIREWVDAFIANSGARHRLREIFHDSAQDGDAFVEPRWVEEKRLWHTFDADGNVIEQNVPAYTGVRFFTISSDSVITPQGYDSWDTLPWFATRHIYTWDELQQLQMEGQLEYIDKVKKHSVERKDRRYAVVQEAQGVSGGIEKTYTVYQIRGRFLIPVPGKDEMVFEELILIYSLDARCFLRKIYNPFFGKFRHLVKVPFLVQPHEVRGMGVAEQVIPFQELASTAYNQVVDAATAANAGIIVTDPESSIARDQTIFPGKIVVSEQPDKTKIIHLSEPSHALQLVVDFAGRMQQVRSAVSDYNLGLESTVVGSRATATGTTALIGQGQMRFNVSIDEMRVAIEELIYLTIQQEQQFRPEGTPLPSGETLVWPKEDPRLAIGLRIRLTSDQINREIEIQGYQVLFTILNEYYARFMQAVSLIMNPSFPAGMKLAAIQVMNASQTIVKRMVERFDIENVDEVVPSILMAMQAMLGGVNAAGGMGAPPGAGPGGPQGLPPGGAPAGPPAAPGGGGVPGGAPPPGGGPIPY